MYDIIKKNILENIDKNITITYSLYNHIKNDFSYDFVLDIDELVKQIFLRYTKSEIEKLSYSSLRNIIRKIEIEKIEYKTKKSNLVFSKRKTIIDIKIKCPLAQKIIE